MTHGIPVTHGYNPMGKPKSPMSFPMRWVPHGIAHGVGDGILWIRQWDVVEKIPYPVGKWDHGVHGIGHGNA